MDHLLLPGLRDDGQRLGVYPTSSWQGRSGIHRVAGRMLDRPRLNETAGEAAAASYGDSIRRRKQGHGRWLGLEHLETSCPRFIDASKSHCHDRHSPPQQFRLLDCTADPQRRRTGSCPSGERRGRRQRAWQIMAAASGPGRAVSGPCAGGRDRIAHRVWDPGP